MLEKTVTLKPLQRSVSARRSLINVKDVLSAKNGHRSSSFGDFQNLKTAFVSTAPQLPLNASWMKHRSKVADFAF
jgi:hypothetical protein